jgi:hypothetical protein
MIIGISGYSGSGKDTAGIIIQYLKASTKLPLKVVLKSPKHHEWWLEERSGWEIKKWAGKLKVIASMLTGIPTEKFEDQEFKKSLLGPEWGTVSTNPLNDIEPFKDVQFNALMSVREFLQKLDTLLEGEVRNVREEDLIYPNWIITDTRFPNEAEAIKKAGGIIIRIERPGIDPVNLHTSETSLDKWNFDHVVVNDGSITDLTKKIKKVLKASKML